MKDTITNPPQNVVDVYEIETLHKIKEIRNSLVDVICDDNRVIAVCALDALRRDILDELDNSENDAAYYITNKFMEKRELIYEDENGEDNE